MAKSPLTGLLGSCNMGGFFAPEMAWAGFHHLVIKGKAEKPVYLFIHNGEIEIRDAANIWGQSVTDSQWAIRDELGDPEVKSMVIGPAGENLVAFANVMTGIKNAGGRTGMGCVMGSKNLKAIACRGTMDIKIAHPVEALEFNKRFIDQITKAPRSTRPRAPWALRLSGEPPTHGAASGRKTSASTSSNTPTTSNRNASTTSPRKPWDRIT